MQPLVILILIGALFVGFSNGANDNFKGFATVWGSHSLSYRRALALATVATVAGGLASVILAHGLVQQFSGKGLVPAGVVANPAFIAAVAIGAAITVIAATRIGMPVSTTHALLGGLVGASLALGATSINWRSLGDSFVLPLVASPVIAAILGISVYSIVSRFRSEADCACVVQDDPRIADVASMAAVAGPGLPSIACGRINECDRMPGVTARVEIPKVFDQIHVLSASAICFARAVNDTPKLAALLIAASVVGPQYSAALIAIAMAIGGLLLARRVAETMSLRINRLDHAQGISANLITAILVIFASRWGLPVSTTHVSVGSISGVGARAGTLDWPALRAVLLSWVATLPFAAGAAWVAAMVLNVTGAL
ncbi:MAG: inorganic phosphate transporter [Sphingomonas sp.]|nr:inorganic phosphate transporter [Sphingomonas sp.]